MMGASGKGKRSTVYAEASVGVDIGYGNSLQPSFSFGAVYNLQSTWQLGAMKMDGRLKFIRPPPGYYAPSRHWHLAARCHTLAAALVQVLSAEGLLHAHGIRDGQHANARVTPAEPGRGGCRRGSADCDSGGRGQGRAPESDSACPRRTSRRGAAPQVRHRDEGAEHQAGQARPEAGL